MPRLPKPRTGEPIKVVDSGAGPRYQVTMNITVDGKRSQVRRRFPDLDEARAFVDRTRLQVREGTFQPANTTTLQELADAWLASRRDIREVSVQGYRQALTGILKQHGDRRVQTITRPDVDRWVASWPTSGGVYGKGWSHRSIVYALNTLRQVLAYGVKLDLIATNPAADVKPPRKTADDHHDTVVWTVPQLRQFLTVTDTDPLAAAWRLTCSGLRRSEVLGMRWADTDLDAGTVTVNQSRVKTGAKKATTTDEPKSAASRRVVQIEAILPGTIALLKALKARQAEDKLAVGGWSTDLIVVDQVGEPVHPDAFGTRFRELCKEAGVPVIHMHSTRHTIASLLHEAGEPPAAVARLLGHEVATHLQFYVKSNDDAAARAAARLGGLLAADQ